MLIAKSKIACLLLLSLTGCATQTQMFNVPSSKVAADDPTTGPISDISVENATQVQGSYTSLTPLNIQRQKVQSNLDLVSSFSGQGNLTFSADALPGDEFIHTVFGEQLQVNYVISDGIPNLTEPFSLNIQESVSPRQLFVLVSELLASRNISITRKDDVFYIHPKSSENPATGAFGFGRNLSDVPQALGLVTQLVPVKYNRDISMEITIRDIAGVKVQEVQGQSAYYFQGEREKVIRAIELLNLLDTPSSRGRHIGLLRLTYISAEDFGKQAAELLASEGLPLDLNKPGNRNLVLVPLPQIGAIAVFSAEQLYVERLNYWAKQLDQPNQGDEKRYFIFHPRFARASDLGESLSSLLGQNTGIPNTRRDTQSAQQATTQINQSQNTSQSTQPSTVIENDKVRMTVDQRSNSLIFYTAGKHYKELMPLVEKLDVMPKQIMLETTIAEVTLTGEFAMGVEFAVKNGNFNMGTENAFGVPAISGFAANYSNNLDKLMLKLRANDKRVNVLSSPSIVVRDGVTAEINVGEDIPTVSGTTENPNTGQQTRSVGSRKTGIKLIVTPSISAQGLVVMEIRQESSNAVPDGTTVEGNQTVFERGISTEVIAQSGQTILLGGLISERKSNSENKIPGFGDLPLIGGLFRSTSQTTDKTELVLLITPRVIDNSEEWDSVRNKLSGALEMMQFVGEKTGN